MDDSEARFAAAVQLHRQGRVGEAEQIYRQLLETNPGHPEVGHLLGVALLHRGRLAEAGPLLEAAIASIPLRPDFRLNFANYLYRSGSEPAALAAYRSVLALEPSSVEAWFNIALISRRAGRLDDAIAGYRRGLAVNPIDAPAQASLGGALYEGSHPRAAVAAYRRSLAIDREPIANSGYLYVLEFDESTSPEMHQIERRRWAHAHLPARAPLAAPPRSRDPERAIRIAFFAPGFDNGNALLIESFLRRRDPAQFHCTLYSNVPPRGETSRAFEALADTWRTVGGLDDGAFDRTIRADAIDILVDTANHVGGHRLAVFAGKPAPIQISGWSHGTGTGMTAMDYVVGDPITIPADECRHFVESVAYVPCRTAFPPPVSSPPVAPAPVSTGRSFTFGHLGRLSKVTKETIGIWHRVLAEAPATRIVLKADLANSATGFHRVVSRLGSDIDPDRIIAIGPKDRFANMTDYAEIDLALDTTPLAGPLTLWESLWMGVPAVTLRGTSQSARASMAMLTATGLTSFIAADEAAYVDLALGLARDPAPLVALRGGLRDRLASSAAGNPDRIAGAMSDLFRAAWRRWCAS